MARYDVRSGVTSTGKTLEYDSMYVFNGGVANTTTANSGGSMHVYSGGIANSTTINSGGELSVNPGGIANSTTVNASGNMDVSSGGIANSTMLHDGGRLDVKSGGTANTTTVNTSGYLFLVSGGTANTTTVNSGGYLFIYSGGTANSTTVNSGGRLYVIPVMATANSTTVNSGGSMFISSGGTATGQMIFEDGAIVSAFGGAIIDFDISDLTPTETARINNLSLVSGWTATYTLTISRALVNGKYKLAEGATRFKDSITVKNKNGEEFGTLTVGGPMRIFEGHGYMLNLGDDNVLSVTVATIPAKSDIDGTGVSDVLFQYTGGDYQLGYWMNGTDTWRGQGLAKPAEWEVLGSYDMNANGKADAVLVGNVEVDGVKGAYVGYYIDSVDTDANWQNIGYLNNADDIAWKNKVGNLTGNESANSIVWYAPELYALGVWTDSTTEWVTLSNSFGGDEWTLVGCGDFDGDGRDSVLMCYNGGQKYYTVGIDGTPSELATSDSGWEVRAIGDFYNDKKDDIIAFHKETGIVAMWGDGSSSNWTQLGQLNPDDWFVVGAGDYGGDDCADLLVRQKSTGMLGYYDFGDMDCWNELGRGVDMNWTVIA